MTDYTQRRTDFDVASLGILVYDVFGKTIDHFPPKGTSAYFDTMRAYPGGCAYNTGVDLARLGMRVAALGMVGNDSFGDMLTRNLRAEGVDTRGVDVSDAANTAFSFIMVPGDGQRRIYTSFGANGVYGDAHVNKEIIRNSRALHIGGASLLPALDGRPMAKLLQFARQNGVLTSMDPVVKPDIGPVVLPCLPFLDLFIPNEEESAIITGTADPECQLRFYIDAGVGLAGVKMGENGCIVSDGKKVIRCGVYDVSVADTCGAGDALTAGFLYGILMGWELSRTAEFATALASFCVRALGAAENIPDASMVLKFMESHKLYLKETSYGNR